MKIVETNTMSAVLDDGTIVLTATAEENGLDWTVPMDEDVSMERDGAYETLVFIGNLVEKHIKRVQQQVSDFPTVLENPEDLDRAPVGSRWLTQHNWEYEKRQDGWYFH